MSDAVASPDPFADPGPKLARLLLDLHRCEHGRLEGDPCVSCGGSSVGNRILPPGMVIGHTLYGQPIRVPAWRDHNDPKCWVDQD